MCCVKKLSINKGETWSWKTSSSSVEINKVTSMDEAERLKKILNGTSMHIRRNYLWVV